MTQPRCPVSFFRVVRLAANENDSDNRLGIKTPGSALSSSPAVASSCGSYRNRFPLPLFLLTVLGAHLVFLLLGAHQMSVRLAKLLSVTGSAIFQEGQFPSVCTSRARLPPVASSLSVHANDARGMGKAFGEAIRSRLPWRLACLERRNRSLFLFLFEFTLWTLVVRQVTAY